jgi:predicted transcriptional regulator
MLLARVQFIIVIGKKIFDGTKRFEYRKTIFKESDVQSVVVYATQSIGKVIGEFKIKSIIEDTPSII